MMETNANCASSQQNSDNGIYQLSARLVSDYLQREGCHKSQQYFHLESPIKSLFTHSCTNCTPPSSLHELLADYYKLLSMVNNQSSCIPMCESSLQIVKASTNRKRKPTRLDQLACIPLQYTNGTRDIQEGIKCEDFNGRLENQKKIIDKHDKSIQNLIHLANMQQKTLQSLVVASLRQNTTDTDSQRKRPRLIPQTRSPKRRAKSTEISSKEAERDEYMTQLIDAILNDQSLLDKLVNYINQSLDTPNDTEDKVAENVMRLTESDPQFGDVLWPS